ncbi:MAG: transposase [Candidatus Kapaibacterium sp.]
METIIITTTITMKNHFDPARHHRRSIRLKGYDYSREGAYFVTTGTYNRQCLFGEIRDRIMLLNDCGVLVQSIWNGLPEHYPHLQLDAFIIMPDHIHGIILLMDDDDTVNIKTVESVRSVESVESVGAGFKPALPPTKTKRHALSEIIRAFKTFSARAINNSRGITGFRVWERNYYEHIIRNEQSLNRIRRYIERNPEKWG